jgi:hypothetical protein
MESKPASQLNPAVVQAMAEIGLGLSREFPKPLTGAKVQAAHIVITMGCGDECPPTPAGVTPTETCPTPPGCPSKPSGRSGTRSPAASAARWPTSWPHSCLQACGLPRPAGLSGDRVPLGQVIGRNAKNSHKCHDCEIARFHHYSGLDLPHRGDAHPGQNGKPLLSYPGVLPALTELASE